MSGAKDLLNGRAQIRGALLQSSDPHQETAGFLQDEAVGELAGWVGLRVLQHGGGRAGERHAGGGARVDGTYERDGDIARPGGAGQVLAFEMEDAVQGDGEVGEVQRGC